MPSTAGTTPPSQQYWIDRRWIHDNYSQLVNDHAKEWIAVHRGSVLAFGTELGAVEDAAREQ